MTVPQLLSTAAEAGSGPARPFLTWYDDSTGERTELSYATLANWVAKTANLLIDQAGLWPGDVVGIDLPPHWLTAAVSLGAWQAGMVLSEEPVSAGAAFVAPDRFEGPTATRADTAFAVEMAPLAVGLRPGPARDAAATGAIDDYLVEVRANGDHFTPVQPLGDSDPAVTGTAPRTHGELVAAARDRAAELGMADGARVLMTSAGRSRLDWLLAPLAVAGSVVLVASDGSVTGSAPGSAEGPGPGIDLAARAVTEHATLLT